MIALEICVEANHATGARQVAQAALEGGAARIELCAAMAADGLTPSWQSLRAARETLEGQPAPPLLMGMVRPRSGDFCYSPAEQAQMLRQVERAARWGADGVVLGALEDYQGKLRIAVSMMGRLMGQAATHGLQVTFHRAFDALADPDAALEQLVQLGVGRVLTAGIPWGVKGSALDGLPRLRRTLATAQERLEVIVAGGVNPVMVPQLLAGLAGVPGRFSLHAYSGAQEHGKTTAAGVQKLVHALRSFDSR